MDFIKLILSLDGYYQYEEASNIAMNILGNFLISDVGCGARLLMKPTLQEWACNDSLGMGFCGNISSVDKEENCIVINDLFADEQDIGRITMTREQFVQLLDEWEEKVCKHKPKEVIIKHINDQFFIETRD